MTCSPGPPPPRRTIHTIEGDGSSRQSLTELAGQLGVADRVDLVGHKAPKGSRRPWDKQTSSRSRAAEASGLVVLRRGLLARPWPRGRLLGSLPWPPTDGPLVDPRELRELAVAITDLLEDDTLWHTLADGGTRTVRSYTRR